MNLKGAKPPESFIDNGHSIPHWWGVLGKSLEALKKYVDTNCPLTGRYHDYAYDELRVKYGVLKRLKGRVLYEHEIMILKKEINDGRKRADRNYKANIEIEGKASGVPWLLRLVIKRRCFGALRRWGWKAIRGEGHPGNAEALEARVTELCKDYEQGV
jgi:hypothetical protein